MDIDQVQVWLRNEVTKIFPAGLKFIVIFGSVTRFTDEPSDVDVLIVVAPEYARKLALVSDRLRSDFQTTFSIPLHLTRLTEEESSQYESILAEMTEGGIFIDLE